MLVWVEVSYVVSYLPPLEPSNRERLVVPLARYLFALRFRPPTSATQIIGAQNVHFAACHKANT